MLVTDAMSTIGSSLQSLELHRKRVVLRDSRLLTDDGTLARAALDMAAAVRNVIRLLDCPLEEALQMASLDPARFLAMDHLRGRAAPGFMADLVAFDAEMAVMATWIGGRCERA